MSFEEFRIHLKPISIQTAKTRYDELSLHNNVEAVRASCSELQYDYIETARAYPPLESGNKILVYDSPLGLFQVFFHLSEHDELLVFMRFAYCNPRSVYKPFCEVAELLMRMFDLRCHCNEDFPPDMIGEPHDIESPEWLREILIPSMDFNKGLWHLDAGTTEEAILRPGDAVARFIVPLCDTL